MRRIEEDEISNKLFFLHTAMNLAHKYISKMTVKYIYRNIIGNEYMVVHYAREFYELTKSYQRGKKRHHKKTSAEALLRSFLFVFVIIAV